jgi:hypothetical protein
MDGKTGTLDVIDDVDGAVRRYEWNGDPEDRLAAWRAFDEVVAGGGFLATIVDGPREMTHVRSFTEIEEREREAGTVTAQISRQLVGG